MKPVALLVACALLSGGAAVAPPRAPATAARKPATRLPATAAEQKPVAPLVEKPVPFAPGETLSYDVSWSSFLTAATATVTVREKRSSFGSVAYYIVAEGQPTSLVASLYKLYYKVDTLLDAFTLLSQRGSLYSKEGNRQRMRSTRFDRAAQTAQYDVQSGSTTMKTDGQQTLPLPPDTQDALSALFVLRTLDFKPGLTLTMPVSLNSETYRVKVTVGERETITSGAGALRCWKLTPSVLDAAGKPEAAGFTIWISDDARRLPVLLQAGLPVGRFGLTLRDVTGAR
jgi:hypothetical protein